MRLIEIRRVSTEEQAADDRSGLDRQAHNNKLTAERLGASLVEPAIVVTDVGRANFVSTPEWRAIRDTIQAPDVHIVVDSTDRFMADFGGIEILAECQHTQTRVYDLGGCLDPANFEGRLLGVIKSMIAGNELAAIKHRVQGAKEAKRRQGVFPSAQIALPTGVVYRRIKGRRKGEWSYNDDIARVREVFRLFVEEGVHNYSAVGRQVGFSGQTTRNILKNPIYKGWWIVDEKRADGPTPIKPDGRRRDRAKIKRSPDEIIRVQVFRPNGSPQDPDDPKEEAVIDEATWDDVQNVIEQKRAGYHRARDTNSGNRFIYRGCLWCFRCSEPIWSKTKPKHGRGSARRDMYCCKSTQVGGECPTKYLNLAHVNQGVDRLFSDILSTPRLADALLSDSQAHHDDGLQEQLDAARSVLKKMQARRAKLLDLYLDDGFAREELDLRRYKIDADIERTERDVARLQRAAEAQDKTKVAEAFGEVLIALREFEFWTPSQKRDFLAKFFPKIEVSKRGVERVHVQLPSAYIDGDFERRVEHQDALILRVEKSWAELQREPEMTEFGLPTKDLYTSGEIASVLGLSRMQFNARVAKGVFTGSTQKKHGKPAWTLEEMRGILAANVGRREEYRWGLPKKPFYTSGDVCRILGVGHDRLRYVIESGAIPDCLGRNRSGHRLWTEGEVGEALLQYVGLGEQEQAQP